MAVNILIKAIDKRGYPFEIRAKTSVVFLRKKKLVPRLYKRYFESSGTLRENVLATTYQDSTQWSNVPPGTAFYLIYTSMEL